MSDRSIANFPSSFSPTVATSPAAARPVAARTKLLLEGPVLSTLLRLSAPNVLNLLAIAGMITFDGLFLGRLGPDALAGVSLAFPFVMLIQHTAASGMGGGVSSAIARALGAGRRDVADALTLHAFVLALGLAAAFSTVLLLGAPFVFRWMGGQGEMLSSALAYSNVAFSGAVAICMLNLLGSAVRGTGNMGLPAGVIVGSVIAHVLISPLLIFGWGPLPALGPAGAGWGLTMSFDAGSLVLLVYLRSRRSLVTLAFRGMSLQWAAFRRNPQGRRAGIGQCDHHQPLCRAADRDRRPSGARGGHRLRDGRAPRIHPHPAGVRFRHGDRRDGRDQLGRQAVSPRPPDRVDRRRDRGCCLRNDWIDRRAFPALWMGLFSDDPEIVRLGTWYLRIVGPIYGLYGLGMALYFATQGFGSVMWTVTANAVRLLASTGCALVAIYWLDLGTIGFFVAIAGGFCAYAALTAAAMYGVKEPSATRTK